MLPIVLAPVVVVGMVAAPVVLVVVVEPAGVVGVGVVELVVVEDGGAGVLVDDVPIGAPVPVGESPVDGAVAFVRVVGVVCLVCAACFAGPGVTWAATGPWGAFECAARAP